MLLAFGLQVKGQKADALEVQKNIDAIFEDYGKIQSKIKKWIKSKDKIEKDSFEYFTQVFINPLLKDIKIAGENASPTQNVLVQFYAIQTYSSATSIFRKHGMTALALKLNNNYNELLNFKTEINGLALTNGVLRNISMEKISIAQYNYLYQLYALANESNNQKLLLFTSKRILNNKRAGLNDQSISAMYLFDVSFAQNDFIRAFEYGELFLNKFANLSFENKKLIKDRTRLENQKFVKRFYESSVNLLGTNKSLLNAQNISKYGVIGQKYSIPNLHLYMQAILVRIGQIDEKNKIQELSNQSKNLKDPTLFNFFEQKLGKLKK